MKYILIFLTINLNCNAFVQFKTEEKNYLEEVHQNQKDSTKIRIYIETGEKYISSKPDSALQYYLTALDLVEQSLKQNTLKDSRKKFQNLHVKCLYKIGFIYYKKYDINRSIEYFEKSLSISEESNNYGMIAAIYSSLGNIYKDQNMFSCALEYFNKSLNMYMNIDDKVNVAYKYNDIGIIYYLQGNYEEAIKQYEKSLKIWDEIGNDYRMHGLYNNLGLVCYAHGNYDQAIKYCEKALTISKEINSELSISRNYGNLGIMYRNQGDKEKALDYYVKSLELSNNLKDSLTIANTLSNIAGIYIEMNDYSKALDYVTRALIINQAINNKLGISIILSNIALLNNEQHNYDKAAESALRALQIAHEIGALEQEKDACSSLSDAYVGLKDYKNALKYLRKYSELEDSIQNERKNNFINEIIIKYETKKKKEEYELLSKEVEIRNYKISYSRRVVAVVLGILFLVILLFILIYRQHINKNRIKELELEQKLYRVQINPRFISNSLSLLKEKILNDTPLSSCSFLSAFAKFMRLILEISNEKYISLESELITINQYFNLQNQALNNILSYSFSTDESIDSKDWIVPPMLMHPFIVFIIEKIIKESTNRGHINVRTINKGEYIILEIKYLNESSKELIKVDNNTQELILERVNHINKLNKNKLEIFHNENLLAENSNYSCKMSVKIPYDLKV